MIVGFFLVKLDLIDYLRNYKVIGWTTIFFGILLYFCDQVKVKNTLDKNFNYIPKVTRDVLSANGIEEPCLFLAPRESAGTFCLQLIPLALLSMVCNPNISLALGLARPTYHKS